MSAVSPDGRFLASASADGTAALIQARTGKTVHTLKGHTAAVWSPVFSPDGTRLATASSDGSVRIWDASTGGELRVLTGNGRGVAAVAWHPSLPQVAVSSWNRSSERGVWGTVNLWDTDTGQRVRQFEHGVKPIGSIAFNRDGSLLAVGTWDFDVAIWDTKTWDKKATLVPPKNDDYQAVRDLSFSPDGSRLAVAYADGRARIWHVDRGAIELTLHTPAEGLIKELHDVAYLPDGRRVATVGGDLTLRLWDATTGHGLSVVHGHELGVNSVVASNDAAWLYTADAGGTIKAWDVKSLEPARSVWRLPQMRLFIGARSGRRASRDGDVGGMDPHTRCRDRRGAPILARS